MCPLFHAAQQRFRQRLFNLRQLQLAAAADRARAARIAWDAYLDLRKRQRAACLVGMCFVCAFRPCRCHAGATSTFWRDQLRLLAGVNPHQPSYRPVRHAVSPPEWRDWNAGKSGNKACGPSFWENAVRAFEGQEDGTA